MLHELLNQILRNGRSGRKTTGDPRKMLFNGNTMEKKEKKRANIWAFPNTTCEWGAPVDGFFFSMLKRDAIL